MNPIIFALRRPYTVMVLVVALALGSGLALTRMTVDIFALRRKATLAIGLCVLCHMSGCERPSAPDGSPAAPTPTAVEIVHAQRKTVSHSVGEQGQFQSSESTAIHARIPGYVKSWSVNIGDTVKKGQALAELSVPELEAEARQKHAAVEQAIAKQ